MRTLFFVFLILTTTSLSHAETIHYGPVATKNQWNLVSNPETKSCYAMAIFYDAPGSTISINSNGKFWTVQIVDYKWNLMPKSIVQTKFKTESKVWGSQNIVQSKFSLQSLIVPDILNDVVKSKFVEVYDTNDVLMGHYEIKGTAVAVKAVLDCVKKLK